MKAFNKYIILLLCIGLLLKHTIGNAQSTTQDTLQISTTGYLVIGGILVGLLVATAIKNHSSKEFRNFKHEISSIDNLIANKNEAIKNRNNIISAFSSAEKYYSKALDDSRANKSKLSERRQYFDRQKNKFSGYLQEYYISQYTIYKNQFFDEMVKSNTDSAHEILNKKIMVLINEWRNIDNSFDQNYFTETQTMDKILSTANAIKKTEVNTLMILDSYVDY